MTATAKVIADSVSPQGIRLTTLQLRYPRMVHAELMTHRAFSRNGRSSRAVPVDRLLAEEPYVPHFMKNQPGMAASEEFKPSELADIQSAWHQFAEQTKVFVDSLHKAGVHKQWANRPLEWFGYIDTLVTSTDWANWDALRLDAGAQPEIRELAGEMKIARDNSQPTPLRRPGQWHLPYVDDDHDSLVIYRHLKKDRIIRSEPSLDEMLDVARKISVARCARLTIKPFDGNMSIEAELARYEKLMVSRPVHASPAEHQATPDTGAPTFDCSEGPAKRKTVWQWDHPEEHRNFRGWRQFRAMIPNESVKD